MKKIAIALLLVGIILVSGCTADKEYQQPENTGITTTTTRTTTTRTTTTTAKVVKSWQYITTFESSNSKKTDTFEIKGEKWRFVWSCDKANDMDGMNIAVYEEGNDAYKEFLFMQKCPEDEETTYIYEGQGTYYFDVVIANVNSWKITVESFD